MIKKNEVREKVWNALRAAGLTQEGVSGLMGNLYSESCGINPRCVEALLTKWYRAEGKFGWGSWTDSLYSETTFDRYTKQVDDGTISRAEFLHPRQYDAKNHQYGYGLAQWTVESRKAGLYDRHIKLGCSIGDLNMQLDYLVEEFKTDSGQYRNLKTPPDTAGKRNLLRSLMNIRMPKKMSGDVLRVQDEYLTGRAQEKGIVSLSDIPEIRDGLSIWQGDITRLAVDAIVNAANSQMLGCFVPMHTCIDNCIHTYAGVQLRWECSRQMDRQRSIYGEDYEQPTAVPMLTDAYNLPAKKVVHIVGPIVQYRLTPDLEKDLADCYRNTLDVCAENGLKSVAFCCISTGVFHFPNKEAAGIAVYTVKEWLAAHPETVTLEPIEYLRLIRKSHGCIVHAHPFRQENYVRYIKLLPDLVDAAEVWNGGNRLADFNDRAKWYAESFGLRKTSGSDAHWETAFSGGILTAREIRSTEDYPLIVRGDGICGLIENREDILPGEQK